MADLNLVVTIAIRATHSYNKSYRRKRKWFVNRRAFAASRKAAPGREGCQTSHIG